MKQSQPMVRNKTSGIVMYSYKNFIPLTKKDKNGPVYVYAQEIELEKIKVSGR